MNYKAHPNLDDILHVHSCNHGNLVMILKARSLKEVPFGLCFLNGNEDNLCLEHTRLLNIQVITWEQAIPGKGGGYLDIKRVGVCGPPNIFHGPY